MAKIFLFDIETAPLRGYMWGMWNQNIAYGQLLKEWYMLTWAGKFLGEDDTYVDSLHLHDRFLDDPSDDYQIVASLHYMIDQADIVVAHNAKKFDVKKMNARFLHHGFEPPSPYKVVDTLEEAKKHFAMTSNRLDALGEALGLGRKIDTGGFELWDRCCNGDPEAFEEMVEYNVGDIELLEAVYLKLRPWMKNHPNLGLYTDNEHPECPKCGSSNLHWRGYAMTPLGKFHRFQCQDCGGWGRERVTALPKEKRRALVANAQ